MAKDRRNTGAQHAIVPADRRQPDETEKAHKARVDCVWRSRAMWRAEYDDSQIAIGTRIVSPLLDTVASWVTQERIGAISYLSNREEPPRPAPSSCQMVGSVSSN